MKASSLSYHNRTFLSHKRTNEKTFFRVHKRREKRRKNINKMEDGFFENLFLWNLKIVNFTRKCEETRPTTWERSRDGWIKSEAKLFVVRKFVVLKACACAILTLYRELIVNIVKWRNKCAIELRSKNEIFLEKLCNVKDFDSSVSNSYLKGMKKL